MPGPPLDFSGVIPPEYSTQIIEEAARASTVLQLANLLPMGTSINSMPVPKTLPTAAWVSAVGGRKAWTDLALQTVTMHAEEVAAVTAIPDQYLEDTSINLWGWVRPRDRGGHRHRARLARSCSAPTLPRPSPLGGVNAVATAVAPGVDAVDTVNQAMGAVEGQGLAVNGHAADLGAKQVFRGVRATTGELLLGTTQAGDRPCRRSTACRSGTARSRPSMPPTRTSSRATGMP